MGRGTAALLGAGLCLAGCSPKFVIHQPVGVKRVCSVTLLAIGIKADQREYAKHYFPRFAAEFKRHFAGKLRMLEHPEGAKSYTWEQAAAIGRELGADAVIGILIDDSSRPPRRMQILKAVKSSNGKILAQQNRLMPPVEDYAFKSEIRGLDRVLECSKSRR